MDTARWAGLWVYLKAKLKGPTGDLAVRCAGKREVQDDPKVFDFGSSKDRVARHWGGRDWRPVRPLGGDAERAPDQGGSADGAHGCAERCPAPPRCALDAGPAVSPAAAGRAPHVRETGDEGCLSPAHRHSVDSGGADSNPNLHPLRCHRGWRRRQRPQGPARWWGAGWGGDVPGSHAQGTAGSWGFGPC